MASHHDLDALVESFAAAVADAVKAQVEQALVEALTGQLPKGRSSARRPRVSKARRSQRSAPRAAPAPTGRRKRRSSAELEQVQSSVSAFVKQNPGCRAEAVGAALGLSSKELGPVLRAMVEGGALKKEGVARGTRYSAAGAPARPADAERAAARERKAKRPAKARAAKKASRGSAGRKTDTSATSKTADKASGPTAEQPPRVRTRMRAPRRDAGTAPAAHGQADAPAAARSAPPARDLQAEALRWVRNNPGDTSTIIGQALRASSADVRSVLQSLIAEGEVVREGEGQGATYSAPQ